MPLEEQGGAAGGEVCHGREGKLVAVQKGTGKGAPLKEETPGWDPRGDTMAARESLNSVMWGQRLAQRRCATRGRRQAWRRRHGRGSEEEAHDIGRGMRVRWGERKGMGWLLFQVFRFSATFYQKNQNRKNLIFRYRTEHQIPVKLS